MKKDIFLETKKSIIAISTSVVFSCLIIFAIITNALYSSKVLVNVDHQILEQKDFITKQPFNFDYKGIFDSGNFNAHENKAQIQNETQPSNSQPEAITKVEGDQKNEMSNKFEDQKEGQIKGFEGKPNGKFMRIPPNLIVIIYKNDTFEIMSKTLYFTEDDLPVFPQSAENEVVTLTLDEHSFRGIIIHNGDYKIQVLANIDSEVDSLNRLKTSIIVSLIILIIIATILSTYLAARVVKPIREAYEKQIYFVQDASHEMRTPLAVIKGKLELLAHSWGDTIDDHFEHISKMMTEVRGLEKLNTDLLLLSKEDLDLAVNITNLKLNNFIEDLSEFYIDLAEIKEKKFNVNKPKEEILVQWDYDKIKRAVVILIENAFKYTGENGEITLSVEDINKHVKITVKDNGIGIKEEEQKRIFDRFYRSEVVRGQNISGTGIGLSLLKSISKNFGIKLKVNSKYGEGSEFILIIPKIIK
ncbi:alkaline phosphatase synthesis sensor protein PhoR [Clostridium puniceum]|uniref:histidine kinase n=1 Tax=Clostridium puniceum TaxID=29367 RepID=A0A1S8TAT1_9CLOT|nr:HAMP domain-containing sensor histidine kinase [Clostridium puniceum]OOM74711.1 alkaline phosphatase synthesis sensor protein PhoR [Clostridium puniceum]